MGNGKCECRPHTKLLAKHKIFIFRKSNAQGDDSMRKCWPFHFFVWKNKRRRKKGREKWKFSQISRYNLGSDFMLMDFRRPIHMLWALWDPKEQKMRWKLGQISHWKIKLTKRLRWCWWWWCYCTSQLFRFRCLQNRFGFSSVSLLCAIVCTEITPLACLVMMLSMVEFVATTSIQCGLLFRLSHQLRWIRCLAHYPRRFKAFTRSLLLSVRKWQAKGKWNLISTSALKFI